MRRGWRTGIPRCSASTLAGVAASARPRPFSRSGWVTTAATSCPASSSAAREGAAKAPAPRKTTRTVVFSLLPVVGARLLPQLALHEVALERSQAIHEEQAVDVVDLDRP